MRFVIAVDPATETGLAAVSYDTSGPPVVLAMSTISFKRMARHDWFGVAEREMGRLVSACDSTPVVLVEDWARHLAYSTAKRLAHCQQTWIDAAAFHGLKAIFIPVLDWQVPIGVNKVRDKRDGKGARKRAALAWATSTYRLDGEVDHNVSDALCMAAVWITKNRMRGVNEVPRRDV